MLTSPYKQKTKNHKQTHSWWKVKGQGHTEVLNVCDTSYHGDTLMCQIWYDIVKRQESCGLNTKLCQNGMEVKRSTSYWDHGNWPMCQIWYASVMANRSYGSDMKKCENNINLTLRSKVNIVSGSWMYVTHHLVVIHPWAKYGMPMPDRNLHRQTDRPNRQTEWFLCTPLL